MNFRYRIIQYMSGRYGVDKLFYALSILYFIMVGINSFLHVWVLYVFSLAVLAVAIFRVLSRNLYKRQREGQAFERLWNKIRSKYRLLVLRLRDRKTHYFRKCPSCRAMLRLPKKKGKHTAVCPRCRHEFPIRGLL
ncbi:MAG TPA: hypothetical protein DEB10_04270 [Ruminococcaceae bacterium]|jgi:Ca2+/Na+ antiporter|nr:hypothetical protein [Oscillospiraceae bacterium]